MLLLYNIKKNYNLNKWNEEFTRYYPININYQIKVINTKNGYSDSYYNHITKNIYLGLFPNSNSNYLNKKILYHELAHLYLLNHTSENIRTLGKDQLFKESIADLIAFDLVQEPKYFYQCQKYYERNPLKYFHSYEDSLFESKKCCKDIKDSFCHWINSKKNIKNNISLHRIGFPLVSFFLDLKQTYPNIINEFLEYLINYQFRCKVSWETFFRDFLQHYDYLLKYEYYKISKLFKYSNTFLEKKGKCNKL